jgi:hypothetical protein
MKIIRKRNFLKSFNGFKNEWLKTGKLDKDSELVSGLLNIISFESNVYKLSLRYDLEPFSSDEVRNPEEADKEIQDLLIKHNLVSLESRERWLKNGDMVADFLHKEYLEKQIPETLSKLLEIDFRNLSSDLINLIITALNSANNTVVLLSFSNKFGEPDNWSFEFEDLYLEAVKKINKHSNRSDAESMYDFITDSNPISKDTITDMALDSLNKGEIGVDTLENIERRKKRGEWG